MRDYTHGYQSIASRGIGVDARVCVERQSQVELCVSRYTHVRDTRSGGVSELKLRETTCLIRTSCCGVRSRSITVCLDLHRLKLTLSSTGGVPVEDRVKAHGHGARPVSCRSPSSTAARDMMGMFDVC
jgi:hypothetical protein